MSKSLKWTDRALQFYKEVGDEFRAAGCKPIREMKDPDCDSCLTFWVAPGGNCVIQQTFVNSGDVLIWKIANDVREALR